MNDKEYAENLYNFLRKNNHAITVKNTYTSEFYQAVPRDELTSYDREVDSLYTFIEKYKQSSIFQSKITPTSTSLLNNFFIHLYQNNPNETKWLFLNIEEITRKPLKDNFNTILNSISSDEKTLIKNIQAFPTSVLDAHSLSGQELEKTLKKKQISDEKIDQFLVSYYKKRAAQLKHKITGPKVRDFLLEKYRDDKDKLKPYFPFFNYLKTMFHEVEVDFIMPTSEHIISTKIDCRKAANTLAIDNVDEDYIKDIIEALVINLSSFNKFERPHINFYDKTKKLLEVFCKTNSEYTKEELNKTITDYLLYAKSSTLNKNELSEEQNIHRWLLNQKLEKNLGSISNSSTGKKNKI